MNHNPLHPEDDKHLQSALGWLELGNHLEANEELDRITPQLRAHLEGFQVRCGPGCKAIS